MIWDIKLCLLMIIEAVYNLCLMENRCLKISENKWLKGRVFLLALLLSTNDLDSEHCI
jgi:hypothetical protein